MYPTTFSNFFIGKAMVRTSRGTQGRADGSNMPRTTFGSSFCFCPSSTGYEMMELSPRAHGDR